MNCFQPFARWWLVLLYHVSFDCHSHFKFGHRGQTEWSANKSGQTNWAWGKQKNSYLPLRSTVWWSIGSYIELYVMTLLSYFYFFLSCQCLLPCFYLLIPFYSWQTQQLHIEGIAIYLEWTPTYTWLHLMIFTDDFHDLHDSHHGANDHKVSFRTSH